jgi:hypothetical protein
MWPREMSPTDFQMPGSFQPKKRFDRMYLRSPTKALNFGLVGMAKVPGYSCFPSDHWGMRCFG